MLLEIEYNHEKEEFRKQTETMGVERKVRRGDAWFPVTIGNCYYNSLNQAVVEVTRTKDSDIEHNFEPGRPVCFFTVRRNEKERDIIVISLVRNNDGKEIGFLRDLRRMNVAITRARMKLIILGSAATMTAHPFYKKLYEWISGQADE